ncbi:T9SS type A sorting domain-containing protein [Bacteroidota bacterium]
MKNHIILLVFILFCLQFKAAAQEWIYSSNLETSGDFDITSSKLLNDSTVIILGTYTGKIEPPADTTSRGGKDIFVASFQNGVFQWLQSIGSSSNEFVGQMVIHSNEVYVTGSYAADCYFPDASFLSTEGGHDIFLAKFASNGTFISKTNIVAGTNNQVPLSLDIDKNDELVLTGFYKDTVGFGVVGYDGRPTTFTNFFAKFNLSGVHQLSKVYDGNNTSTRFYHIKAFDDGYYITGQFLDSVYFDIGSLKSTNTTSDMFLYKMDYSGNGQWVRRTYGNSNDVPGSVTQDSYGNMYFTGFFRSDTLIADSTLTLVSDHNVINHNTDNSFDFFIIKYNKTGNLIWSNGYGSKGDDWARSIETRNGFVYLSGYFSDTLIFQSDTIEASSITDEDPFIGMFNTDGNKIKAVSVTGSGENLDHAQSINLNSKNQAIIAGFYESPTLTFDADDILSNSNPGNRNLFLGNYVPPFSISITDFSNITCNSGTDGEITVTPYFGVPPYNYDWSHNGLLEDSTATNLTAGTYTITVTDFLDSTDIVQYQLNEPNAFIFNPVITDVTTCSYNEEGAINLNVEGGNGGNSYVWAESEGGNGVALNDEDQTNLAIGRYDVTVTDSKFCTDDATIYITGPGPVIFNNTIVTDDSGVDPLHNGAIDLELTGGTGTPSAFGASWTGPSGFTALTQDISSLEAGAYNVTVTDGNSCTFDSSFTVLDLDTLFAYVSYKKDDCTGGAGDGIATVSYYTPNPTPVISYSWSNGGTDSTITGLVPGIYYVTVTDSDLSETSVDSVEILDLAYTIAGNLSGSTSVDCKGDTDGYIDLTITTPGQLPYDYNWSSGQTTQDITGLIADTYSVTVTDDNECTLELTNYNITEPADDLVASASVVDNPTCNGYLDGSVRVDAAGGNGVYTYEWDDPAFQTTQIANSLEAGTYYVTVTDFKGCTTTDNVILTEPDVLTVSGIVGDLDCFGDNNGTIALTVGGGTPTYDYYWTTADGSGLVATNKNQSGLTGGTYDVTVTDANSCEATDSYDVIEPLELQITNEEKTDVTTCYGDNSGTITITTSGGTGVHTYTLNPGAIQTNSTGIFTGIQAGTYTVDVDDENNCGPVTSNSIIINEPTAINIEETTVNDISCNGLTDGSIDITVTGGTVATVYAYNWSTADGSGLVTADEDQTGLGAGTYDLTVTDDNLCTATTSITINEPTAINIVETAVNDITCNGDADGSIDITVTGGTPPYAYSWNTTDGSGLVTDVQDQTGLGDGTYNLTVTDDNLCIATTSITIIEPDVIDITTDISNISCYGLTDGGIDITASGGTVAGNYTYVWTTSDGYGLVPNAEDQTGLDDGTYDLTITDDNACSSAFQLVLDDPSVITIDSEDTTNASSASASDGSITVSASGGTGTLTYEIDPGGDINTTGVFTGLSPDDYTVEVTDDNDCGPITSNVLTVGFPDAIDDIIANNKVKIYPNPTSDRIFVEIDYDGYNLSVEVLSISGQILFNKTILTKGLIKEEIDLSEYAKGIYFIRIYNNDFNFEEKVLLQ